MGLVPGAREDAVGRGHTCAGDRPTLFRCC